MIKIVKMALLMTIVGVWNVCCLAMQPAAEQAKRCDAHTDRQELLGNNSNDKSVESTSIIHAVHRMHSDISAQLGQLEDRVASNSDQFESEVSSRFAQQEDFNNRVALRNELEQINQNVKAVKLIAIAALVVGSIPLAINLVLAIMKS